MSGCAITLLGLGVDNAPLSVSLVDEEIFRSPTPPRILPLTFPSIHP